MAKKHIKTMNENFMMDDTKVAPGIAKPGIGTPVKTPPKRERETFTPRIIPKPGEQNKPQATADDVADIFLMELEKIKDTPRGEEIIKNLYDKYAR